MAMNGINGYASSTMIQRVLSAVGVNTNDGLSSTYSNDILNSSLSRVTISTFGSQINQIYNRLKTIEDPAEREAALGGMRDVFTNLVTDPSTDKMFSFVSTANRTSETDLTAFQAIFTNGTEDASNAPDASDTAQASTRWTDMYGAVSASGLNGQFANAGLGIITAEGGSSEKQQTYDALLAKSYDILNADLTDTERANVAEAFFNGLSDQSSVADKQDFISNFDIQETLAASEAPEGESEAA